MVALSQFQRSLQAVSCKTDLHYARLFLLNTVGYESNKQLEMCPKYTAAPASLGLQRYTELLSIRDMGSGKQAYRIASRIFPKFANFLQPVIVLKQSLASIISGDMYVFRSMRESVFALRDPVNLKITIIGKCTASGF